MISGASRTGRCESYERVENVNGFFLKKYIHYLYNTSF
ncbi:hypothetical protein HMPREF1528_00513 [Capnocytophaga sp. oral taxon 336 str. F0502]|nr:hypothetical protein HMPREF1528_00513 [Capnocytophaga sp. oral taxon 336 str. F0502]